MWAWPSWGTTCTRSASCCCVSRPRAPRPPAASARSVPPPLEAGAHARGGRAATPQGCPGGPSVHGAAPAGVGGRTPLEHCRRSLDGAAIPEPRAGTFRDLKDRVLISRRTLDILPVAGTAAERTAKAGGSPWTMPPRHGVLGYP